MLATLLLSQGVPMISHGDEVGRTQHGNNNAYCQDNEITWIDWNLTDAQKELCEFTRKLVHLRLSQPVLRRRKYFQGRSIRGSKDVAWLAPDGQEMNDEAWNADFVRSIGMLLNGNAIEEENENGELIVGDSLLILLNAHSDKVPFTLPPLEGDHQWQRILDTRDATSQDRASSQAPAIRSAAVSVAVLRVTPPVRERRRSREATRTTHPPPLPSTRRSRSASKDDLESR